MNENLFSLFTYYFTIAGKICQDNSAFFFGGERRSRTFTVSDGWFTVSWARHVLSLPIIGCPGRARTSDPMINSHLLYQLSYWAIGKGSSVCRRMPPMDFSTTPRTEINAFDYSQITMSEWLVPTLWSLRLISSPSHRPSTFELCVLLMPFSWTWTTSKLCRWLAGENQRIYSPLFYLVNILLAMASPLNLFSLCTYIISYSEKTVKTILQLFAFFVSYSK